MTMAAPRFLLHHAPNSRSALILWLLEEVGAPYEVALHSLETGSQKRPDFLALNPFGKVPALLDRGPQGDWRGVVVTETAGICRYLADAVPEAGLAPAIGMPARAAYETWSAMVPGVLEPAFADLVFPRAEPMPAGMRGWPEFAEAAGRIEATLTSAGPWLLGARFSAVDAQAGALLGWVVGWGRYQPGPATAAWLAAIEARPARQRAKRRDAA
jgi:glutathione S-transferase